MNPVERKSSKAFNVEILDEGVSVRDALKLISNSPYQKDIIDIFRVEELLSDFIAIKGAAEVVHQLIATDEECLKIDIDSELKNVNVSKITEDGQIILEIINIKDEAVLKKTKKDLINAKSIYTVKSDFLNEMYKIDKYLDFCFKSDYQDIITTNLEMLKEKNKDNTKSKKFRILKNSENNFFVRGITSVDAYKDYNLRISLFIALIELHKLIKFKSQDYYIDSYSFTESDLKIIFKSEKSVSISKNTQVGFALELINDEIRRDAVKFNGIFTLTFGDDKEKRAEIYIKPEESKSNILAFTHKENIDTLKGKLNGLNELIGSFIQNVQEDAKKIKLLEKPELLREYLVFKIQNSKNTEFNTNYKTQIKNLLSNRVNTIFELATIFNKIELLIADEHISSLDFWRYKLYQVLMEEFKGSKGKSS